MGTVPLYGDVTLAEPGTLFWAGDGPGGGDGIYRSTDGGDTWQLLTAGLPDLRVQQPVLARSADEVYVVCKTGGILAWRPAEGRWQRIVEPPDAYSSPGSLSLAPDDTLFLVSSGDLRRSSDGGATWTPLQLPGDGGEILAFSPEFAADSTLYGLWWRSAEGYRRHLMRSTDAGATWRGIEAGLDLPDFVSNLQLIPHGDQLYLYLGDYLGDSQLYRSDDRGDHWDRASGEAVQGTISMAIAPDGVIWLVDIEGNVRSLK